MNVALKLRDPTSETSPTRRARLAPPPSVAGKSVALMDIGKSRGAEFIDRLEGHFRKAGVATRRYRKPEDGGRKPARGDRAQRLRLLYIVQSARPS